MLAFFAAACSREYQGQSILNMHLNRQGKRCCAKGLADREERFWVWCPQHHPSSVYRSWHEMELDVVNQGAILSGSSIQVAPPSEVL